MIRRCGVVAFLLSVALPLVASAVIPSMVCAASRSSARDQDDDNGSQLYTALAANLAPDANRPVARLPQVSIDPAGDATIVFAIRNENDDASAIRAGALADTLTVLRTVYESAPASGVSSVTVLGTFPFQSTKGKSVRESPVLRAVLSADRAEQIDWNQLTPNDVPNAVDVWWLQGAFADVSLIGEATSSTTQTGDIPAEVDALGPRLSVAMAHLDEALLALNSGDLRVGRSQFKQFFDVWDEVDGTLGQLYPTQYAALDVSLEHAEIALLHSQPEDVEGARAALQSVRAYLADITHDHQT